MPVRKTVGFGLLPPRCHGYNQVFAIDAMAAIAKEEHEATKKFIFPRIGLIRTTEGVLNMMG